MISSWVTELAPCRNDHMLVLSGDLQLVTLRLAGDAAVLLRQEGHGVVDAVEVAPR